jgi:hypothetical protein
MTQVPTLKRQSIITAGAADAVARHLSMAGLHDATPDEIRHYGAKAFQALTLLNNEAAKLRLLMPRSAEAGEGMAHAVREIA